MAPKNYIVYPEYFPIGLQLASVSSCLILMTYAKLISWRVAPPGHPPLFRVIIFAYLLSMQRDA